MTLNNAQVGKTHIITGFSGEVDRAVQRLLELGFTKNQKVRVLAKSIKNQVFLVEIRGFCLSVRAKELQKVQVK